jgi:hypothetical protein
VPRPDKQISNRGPLDGPVSASRPVVWKKYAGPETIEVSDDPSAPMEVTIDGLTISTQPSPPPGEISKWATRATSAQLPLANDEVEGPVEPVGRPEPQPTRTEWVVTRTIDGRTYRRTDVLTTVEDHAGA